MMPVVMRRRAIGGGYVGRHLEGGCFLQGRKEGLSCLALHVGGLWRYKLIEKDLTGPANARLVVLGAMLEGTTRTQTQKKKWKRLCTQVPRKQQRQVTTGSTDKNGVIEP